MNWITYANNKNKIFSYQLGLKYIDIIIWCMQHVWWTSSACAYEVDERVNVDEWWS